MEDNASRVSFAADELAFVPFDDELLAYVWLKSNSCGHYLTFCRQEDEQAVYVERDDQKWGSYHGVSECIVSPDIFVFKVTGESARELEAAEWRISYKPSASELELLESVLKSIFAGTNTKLTLA